MNKFTTIISAIIAVVLVGLIAWTFTRNQEAVVPVENEIATTTPAQEIQGEMNTSENTSTGGTVNSNSGLGESYANATHGFTISYPRELTTENFGVFHALNNNDWRFGATAEKRGTPVVAIPIIKIDNMGSTKKNYPLFYTAEVRVGVSTDVDQCYAKENEYTSPTVTDVTINGVAFKKFDFGSAATQQYVSGSSYRTIRNNTCYVIEQIRNGSSYRDETLTGGYSDADLDAFYAKTRSIVMSFTFTK